MACRSWFLLSGNIDGPRSDPGDFLSPTLPRNIGIGRLLSKAKRRPEGLSRRPWKGEVPAVNSATLGYFLAIYFT
jgi:hypothetical protein